MVKKLLSSSSLKLYWSVYKKTRFSVFLLASLLFLLLFFLLYIQDRCLRQRFIARPVEEAKEKWGSSGGEEQCDVFTGRWVRDEKTRPFYREAECPYIKPWMACQRGGRPDRDYLDWRWQPRDCTLPRFNATELLEALRGRRMMFVGDSINRGQFTSMLCLLQSAVPKHSQWYGEGLKRSHVVFSAMNYNASVEFYWAPFLLESNCDDSLQHRVAERIVRNRSIETHGEFWKGVDVLVFDTYLWWTSSGSQLKILQGSFEDEVKNIVNVPILEAFSMALRDLLQWVRQNMDLTRSRVFFSTMSPTHYRGTEWGGEASGNCYNETTVIDDPSYWGSENPRAIMRLVQEILGEATDVPVTLMNITQLSMYRKDAHMSIYKRYSDDEPLPEAADGTEVYADCVHWCTPGVHDTWNELLFAKLLYPHL